ncbi:MAG: hypothetical protein ACYCZF_03800 [Anaerolineae bacterium]
MLKSTLMLCARGIVIDARSNNVSVFSIIEELTPSAFPGWFPEITILSILEREETDPNEIECQIDVTIGANSLLSSPTSLNFQDKYRIRSVLTINGLPLSQPGKLIFAISYNKTILNSYVINIKATETEIIPEVMFESTSAS